MMLQLSERPMSVLPWTQEPKLLMLHLISSSKMITLLPSSRPALGVEMSMTTLDVSSSSSFLSTVLPSSPAWLDPWSSRNPHLLPSNFFGSTLSWTPLPPWLLPLSHQSQSSSKDHHIGRRNISSPREWLSTSLDRLFSSLLSSLLSSSVAPVSSKKSSVDHGHNQREIPLIFNFQNALLSQRSSSSTKFTINSLERMTNTWVSSLLNGTKGTSTFLKVWFRTLSKSQCTRPSSKIPHQDIFPLSSTSSCSCKSSTWSAQERLMTNSIS